MKQKLADLLQRHGGELDPATTQDSVRQEFQTYVLLSGVNPTFVPVGNRIEQTPPSRFAKIKFVNRTNVNAITAVADEAPALLIYAATPFALYDYYSALLSYPEILPDFDSSGETEELRRGGLRLNLDYAGIIRGKFPDSIPLTASDVPTGWTLAPGAARHVSWRHYLPFQPKNERRRDLGIHLYMIAVNFLFQHELAHVDNGHLEFADRKFGATTIPEFAVDNLGKVHATRISPDILCALELDADLVGIESSLRFSVGGNSVARDSLLGRLLGSIDINAALHLWLFSLAALFCLFEFYDSRNPLFRWLKGKLDHPRGFTRVFASMIAARKILGNRHDVQSAVDEAEKKVLGDISRIVRVLGIESSWNKFLHNDEDTKSAKTLQVLQQIGPELNESSARLRDKYYVRGIQAQNAGAGISTRADDPFHLAGQSVELFHENGVVRERRFFYPPRTEYYDEDGNLINVQEGRAGT